MSLIPGLGIAKGMALTLRRFFEPKVTVMYPEDRRDPPHKFRGRLQLLYDEWGTLKCETCFQCAQACPIECIDMGGMDTRGRYHVHWGPPETYGERREESALRRSGRTVPDPAYRPFAAIDVTKVDAILDEFDRDPAHMLQILEATQAAYGYLPIAALKRISNLTGAWYAMIYGTASYYAHLRFEPRHGHRPGRRGRCASAVGGIVPRRPGCLARRRRRRGDRRREAGAGLMAGPAQDAVQLADDPARASRRQGPDRPRRRGPGRARSRACGGPSATSVRPGRSPRSRASGLRGLGGSGYPTGDKWRTAAATEAPRRYVVANGYGADPAAGTDRFLMEHDPFAVVEGTAIAALRDRGHAKRSSPSGPRRPRPIRRLEAADRARPRRRASSGSMSSAPGTT